MNNLTLAHYFTLERRYTRSINLERDFDDGEALKGYILTDKAIDVVGRVLRGLTRENNSNCWTLTGVYGTGKSAFCHYLTCLLSPKNSNIYKSTFSIIESILNEDNELIKDYKQLINNLPKQGFIRAIAVSQRESITNTIIRALSIGLDNFKLKNKTHFQEQLESFNELIKIGKTVKNTAIIALIKEIISQAKTDLIFIIDELGKNLEYAVYNQEAEDVYLLQQLAELESINGNRVYILGILHQAFTE
jgi:Cdc6-like AAA superfamily ATPase